SAPEYRMRPREPRRTKLKLRGVEIFPLAMNPSRRTESPASLHCAQPPLYPACQGYHCQRFLCRRDGNLPVGLCVRDSGSRHASNPALQSDAIPYCRMDAAAVSRVCYREEGYRFVIHDRDSTYSRDLDATRIHLRTADWQCTSKDVPYVPIGSAKTAESVSILLQGGIHDSNSDCHLGISPPPRGYRFH